MAELDTILEREIEGQGIFVSRFKHSLDSKKRLTIPSEWRAQINAPRSLYVIPDVHHPCLRVFPSREMIRRLEKMRHHSIADRTAREFARVLASQSDLVAWDSQGRIRVKDALMEFAGLSDQVVLVGAFDSFELWSPEKLESVAGLDQGGMKDAARYVGI